MEGGCLAWTIVFSSFLIHFFESGFSDSFGLILPAIRETFRASNASASLTNSLVVFLTLGSSPLVAWLATKIGNRAALAAGVILASCGLLAAGVYIDLTYRPGILNSTNDSLSTSTGPVYPNIMVLYVMVGVFTGIGFGLTYLPLMTVIEMYFSKRLGLACGIAQAGTGLGQTVMAPIVSFILERHSLAVVLYFFAATFSISLPLCFFFKTPNNREQTEAKRDQTEDHTKMDNAVSVKLLLAVFTTPAKIILLTHVFLLNIGIYAVYTYFPERALSFGLSQENATSLLSIMGFGNFIARILSGVIIDKFRSQTIHILTSVHLINGLSILASVFLKSFPAQATTAAIFGIGFGTKVTCMVVLAGLLDKNITHLLSAIYLSVGISSLVGPSVVGFILDFTDSFFISFLVVSVFFILGGLCLPLAWVLHNRADTDQEEYTKM